MIEVLSTPAREVKGTNARGNYHFFEQIALLRTVDRDGIEEAQKFRITSEPGECYEPGNDYAVDASSLYLARDEKGNDVLRVRRNVKLVRVGGQAIKLKAA